jgi:hypothetical protein
MTQLTLNLPDELASRLPAGDEVLAAIIERGLDHFDASSACELSDLRDVLERLAALPSPEEVLKLRASPQLQSRIAELLAKNSAEGLSQEEQQELTQIELLEHLVRLAKGKAYTRLMAG